MTYLDHHAAAPMPELVRRAMAECAPIAWANPSSTHAAGRASRQLLEDARDSIAEALGVAPGTVKSRYSRAIAAMRAALTAATPSHAIGEGRTA